MKKADGPENASVSSIAAAGRSSAGYGGRSDCWAGLVNDGDGPVLGGSPTAQQPGEVTGT